jgi:hypothetical protein
MIMIVQILPKFCYASKSDLDGQQILLSKGWFVEQELMLSWSFRCDVCHAFVLLKSDLSVKNTSKSLASV